MRELELKYVDVNESGLCKWNGQSNPFTTNGSYETIIGTQQKLRWARIIWNGLSPLSTAFVHGSAFMIVFLLARSSLFLGEMVFVVGAGLRMNRLPGYESHGTLHSSFGCHCACV